MSINQQMQKLIRDQDFNNKCKSCGSSDLKYEGLGEYKCRKCGIITLNSYGKIREYIGVNGIATPYEIMAATGVSRNEINNLIDKGDLKMVGGRIA